MTRARRLEVINFLEPYPVQVLSLPAVSELAQGKVKVDDLFEIDSTTTAYTKWRPIKLNSSISYNFGRKTDKECNCLDKSDPTFQNRVGAHLFAMKRPNHLQWALSAFYYRKFFKGLQLKTTYTVDAYSFKNVGLGMSAVLGPVQFYIMADNLLDYQNLAKSQSVSLQLGFNYIFKNNDN